MIRFTVMSVAAISGIVAFAAAVASFRPHESVQESLGGLRINGLHASIRSEPEQWSFVENGGHGEKIHLYISLSTSDSNWQHLEEIGGLEFDAKPSLIRILARTDGGPEFELEPSEFRINGMIGSNSGAEWSCGGDLSLSKIILPNGGPPRDVAFRVALSEDFIGHVTQAEGLASNALRVKLRPQPFAESTFTKRLYSLAPNIATDEVRRILGEPVSDSPVDAKLKENHTEYARRWVYRNPDLKDVVLPSGKNGDLVTMYFNADGRLVAYVQSIYGC